MLSKALSSRRPRNSKAAPDVRAPVVRGRWHFGPGFDGFCTSFGGCSRRFRLGTAGGGGYTLAHERSDPAGPRNPQQTTGLPVLSVVVPHSMSATTSPALPQLDATLTGSCPGSRVRRRQFPRQDLGGRARSRAAGQPRPLHPADRAARPVGACIEGILASSAPYAAVMDADLQHDETQLPEMLSLLRAGRPSSWSAAATSKAAAPTVSTSSARAPARSRPPLPSACSVAVADPMSGFFMIRRDKFEQFAPRLSTQGFKILLDIVATAHGELDGRGSLHLRRAAAWREQARFHGGAGFPRAGAREIH